MGTAMRTGWETIYMSPVGVGLVLLQGVGNAMESRRRVVFDEGLAPHLHRRVQTLRSDYMELRIRRSVHISSVYV